MQRLFIDGKELGEVVGYRQNEVLNRWSFLMAAGYYISVDFNSIKSFTSCGNLEIVLYH